MLFIVTSAVEQAESCGQTTTFPFLSVSYWTTMSSFIDSKTIPGTLIPDILYMFQCQLSCYVSLNVIQIKHVFQHDTYFL